MENKNTEIGDLIEEFFGNFSEFSHFLLDNEIEPATYLQCLKNYCQEGKRYFRVSLTKDVPEDGLIAHFSDTLQKSGDELELNRLPGPFLSDVWSLPINVKINNILPYKQGDIYGIDFSSCLVVKS